MPGNGLIGRAKSMFQTLVRRQFHVLWVEFQGQTIYFSCCRCQLVRTFDQCGRDRNVGINGGASEFREVWFGNIYLVRVAGSKCQGQIVVLFGQNDSAVETFNCGQPLLFSMWFAMHSILQTWLHKFFMLSLNSPPFYPCECLLLFSSLLFTFTTG